MLHRFYPVLGGLALGLAVFAPPLSLAAANGDGAEYNRVQEPGLASRERPAPEPGPGSSLVAQNYSLEDEENTARRNLKAELDRIRRENGAGGGAPSFDPPIPVRRKSGSPALSPAAATAQPPQQGGRQADPRIDRLTGQLLIMNFKGSQPSDPGPRQLHALLQSGLIAGALFGRGNIQSKAQLKELMRFLWQGGPQNRPLFAIREIGGASDALPPIKDFEQWPSEKDVAAKGDPQYAYSTYRSLGSALAGLGFNINFGPVLTPSSAAKDQAMSFGSNPLQTGVFAKTFILGHREENITAVPIVDGSEHSVRALKTLLVSNPEMPVAASLNTSAADAPFSAYEGLVRGVKFCFLSPPGGNDGANAVRSFTQGCDVLVLQGGSENPATVRDEIALALGQAARSGELTLDNLAASAQRIGELRFPGGNGWPAAARSQ